MNYIITELDNKIGSIILNHPKKVNPLSKAMIEEMCRAFEDLTNLGARVIVLRAAAGSKVFSAGHDVSELSVDGSDPLKYDDPLRKVIRSIEKCPVPIIALIEGSVWGGACELAVACDIVVASDSSTFAITPAKMGMAYNLSGILRFIQPGGLHLVKEMIFTARPFPALRLAECGIINYALPMEQVEETVYRTANEIIAYSPLVLRVLKEEMRVLSDSFPMNPEQFEEIQALRTEVYTSYDYREAIQAFKEKRRPHFEGR